MVCPYTLQTYTQEWYNWLYYAYLEESPWCSPQFVFPQAERKYSFPYSLLSVVLTVALMTRAPWVLCITLIRIRLSNVLKKHLLSILIFLGLDLFIQLFANLFKGWCFAVYFLELFTDSRQQFPVRYSCQNFSHFPVYCVLPLKVLCQEEALPLCNLCTSPLGYSFASEVLFTQSMPVSTS